MGISLPVHAFIAKRQQSSRGGSGPHLFLSPAHGQKTIAEIKTSDRSPDRGARCLCSVYLVTISVHPGLACRRGKEEILLGGRRWETRAAIRGRIGGVANAGRLGDGARAAHDESQQGE
jgi:hypothetical protein